MANYIWWLYLSILGGWSDYCTMLKHWHRLLKKDRDYDAVLELFWSLLVTDSFSYDEYKQRIL